MKMTRLAAVFTVVVALAACAPGQDTSETPSEDPFDAATATSAQDFGGMDQLVEAAKAEGQLNVIALPPDWANYGAVIEAFEAKYGIAVNSAQPDASSQEEINAANHHRGTDSAPDVFDLGQSVALANTAMFAPYKVATFDTIDEEFKDPDGIWVSDYGGNMSIGYDSSAVPDIASVGDLLKPEYLGKVALNGDPTQAGAAFSGVMMTAISQGGSADDIAPGVEFFRKLKQAGNYIPVDPSSATIESGQTPVVLDWDYLNSAETEKLPTWRVFVPGDAVVAGYYNQAINKDAPHPAAARLWQEFVFSDEGQNLFLEGGARPVRAEAMAAAGTLDMAAWNALPFVVDDEPVIVTVDQNKAAADYLSRNWATAIR